MSEYAEQRREQRRAQVASIIDADGDTASPVYADALAQRGYVLEGSEYDPDTYEEPEYEPSDWQEPAEDFDWSDENTVPISEAMEHFEQPQQFEQPPEMHVDPVRARAEFDAHVDQLEQRSGIKVRGNDREQLLHAVWNSGTFGPDATENLFAKRWTDHETDLELSSRDPDLTPEMRRRARRERIARTMERGA